MTERVLRICPRCPLPWAIQVCRICWDLAWWPNWTTRTVLREVGVGGCVEVLHHVLVHIVEVADQIAGGGNAQALGVGALHVGALRDLGEAPGLVQSLSQPDRRLAVLADEVDDVVLGADVVPGVEAGRDGVVVVAPVELVVVEVVERGNVAVVQGLHEMDQEFLNGHSVLP